MKDVQKYFAPWYEGHISQLSCFPCLTYISNIWDASFNISGKEEHQKQLKKLNYYDFHWWHFPAAYGSKLMGQYRFLMNTWGRGTKGQCCCRLVLPCEMIMCPQQDFEATKLMFLAARRKTWRRSQCICTNLLGNDVWCLFSQCQPLIDKHLFESVVTKCLWNDQKMLVSGFCSLEVHNY